MGHEQGDRHARRRGQALGQAVEFEQLCLFLTVAMKGVRQGGGEAGWVEGGGELVAESRARGVWLDARV